MKFTVASRGDTLSNDLCNTIKERLLKGDLIYDEEHPDIVITVGGDGTLLEAFHLYSHRLEETAFVGIHTGTLVFMQIGFRKKRRILLHISLKRLIRSSSIRC